MMSTRNHFNNSEQKGLCQETSIQLASYVAGELEASDVAKVKAHLKACPDCSAELSRELDLRLNLANMPEVECPTSVTRSVLAAIEDGTELPARSGHENAAGENPGRIPPLSRQWTSYLGWAAAAAAAFMIFFNPLDQSVPTEGDGPFSAEEIATARKDAARGLLLAINVIDQAERSTVKEVFGQQLPRSIKDSLNRSIKNINLTPEGEQG